MGRFIYINFVTGWTISSARKQISFPILMCESPVCSISVSRIPMYVLGYIIPAHKKISLVDRDVNVYIHGLPLAVVEM